VKKIDILSNNKFYSKLYNVIYKTIGVNNFKVTSNDLFISFQLITANQYSFVITFWLNNDRISFDIEDWYEIQDQYIENENDTDVVFQFIDTIFRNRIIMEEYGTKGKVYKKSISYTTKINGVIETITQNKIIKLSFFWNKVELINRREFNPIY